MLLDSDSSLKVAHDIIHDANEFFTKWPWLIAQPEDPLPEDSTVTLGYVDFEYSDGALYRIPCAWSILQGGGGDTRKRLIFKNSNVTATWTPGAIPSAIGAFNGVISDAPVVIGGLSISALMARNNGEIRLESPVIANLDAAMEKVSDTTIETLVAANEFELGNCSYGAVSAPESTVTPSSLRCDEIIADTLECTGEQVIHVESFNAWGPLADVVTPPQTDARYGAYLPWHALSEAGAPINGYANPLESNPFYPDKFYVCGYAGPSKAQYAWVPSKARPSAPHWVDSDGLYWHKVSTYTDGPLYGSGAPNLTWPIRTSPGKTMSGSEVPPVKASVDGMLITVRNLADREVPICLTDTYRKLNDRIWRWEMGYTRKIKAQCACEFMVKRVLTWSCDEIIAVEYQLLPTGAMND